MPTTAVAPSTRTHSWSLLNFTVMAFPRSCRECDLAAVIAMRHEGKRHHLGRPRRAAHQQHDGRARRRVRGGDVAHGDRAVDAGPEAAAGDAADGGAGGVLDLGALASRRLALGTDAHAPARDALAELL